MTDQNDDGDTFTVDDLSALDGGEPTEPDGLDDDQDDDGRPVAYELGIDLPDFEGHRVADVATHLAAVSVGSVRRPLHHDDTVVLVIEAKVVDVAHPRKDGQITRSQRLKASADFEIADEVYADDLLRTLRRARLRADDAAAGRTAMEVRTTSNGVVLTPGDQQTEPFPPVPVDDSEVVVIFSEAVESLQSDRAMWPDDFPVDVPRPTVGERVQVDVDDDATYLVVQLLDPVRGDVVAALVGYEDDTSELDDEPPVDARSEIEEVRAFAREVIAKTQGPAMTVIAETTDLLLLTEIQIAEEKGKGRRGILGAVKARRAALDAESF